MHTRAQKVDKAGLFEDLKEAGIGRASWAREEEMR